MMAAAMGAAKPRIGNSAAANSATKTAMRRLMSMIILRGKSQ
jgi:hypothetical protein